MILKRPSGLELEKEVSPLRINQKGRIAFGESHQKMEAAAATIKLSTIAITTTQTTALVNFLLCMLL